jgi:hypothetical protein
VPPPLDYQPTPCPARPLQVFTFIFSFSFMFPASRLIRGVVYEKEAKIREGVCAFVREEGWYGVHAWQGDGAL